MRTPLALIAVLVAGLIPLSLSDSSDEPSGAAEAPATAPVATIAERVERLRGLSFKRTPVPDRVSPETAQREGLADLDMRYPTVRRRADEALYTLLGLLPAGTDLRDATSSIFGEQVAGYYDPRDGRLRIVEGAATSNRVLDEMVISHELTHALEDQRFGLDLERAEATGDPAIGYLALVEGTASALMEEYVARHFGAEEALGGLLGGAFVELQAGDLPPFLMAGLIFPYLQGQEFVEFLYRRGGGGWTLVDLALRSRPPVSTEQVIHPRAWLRVDVPEQVSLPGLRRALGRGWQRVTAGTFGEFQTGELIALGGRRRADAVDHWAGDRYELWRRGRGACETPCVSRDALVMRWRWDTRADAAHFTEALRGAVRESASEREGARASVQRARRETTLVVAPDGTLAAKLAR